MSMEIRRRVGLPRMRFHVMNRGARKVGIFEDDADRRIFISLLAKFTLKYRIKLLAWCLMSNHYHLEPEGEGTPLSRMMHDLDGTYAKVYNQRHGGSGCLFQGRFKSMAILDDDGMVYVSRYIHANPLAFGVRPEQYPWSSCGNYLGDRPAPGWLDPEPVLSLFGSNSDVQRNDYGLYLQSAPPPRRKDDLDADDREEFYRDFVRHVDQKCRLAFEEVGPMPQDVTPSTLGQWFALRRYRLPARNIAQYYGLRTAASVRVMMSRLAGRIETDPGLSEAFRRVNELVARFR
jgi:REP element-mobilizing transposase RayT